ncbi:MAG: outer membrane protein transport protein [Parabacteroides sp.]|nr:outer membrane protein transport protein [Parabacteroides sp.]
MKKKVLLSASLLMASSLAFAGGLLTNTNQNASFLRNPSRNAVIAIDGVYSNPAGIAYLPKGFHMSLSWQGAWQKRQITSTAPFYPLGTMNNGASTKLFEGVSKAPVIPSFQAAYVFNDKWSISGQFAVGGGGGKCEFANGLPMFEKLVYSQLATGVAGKVPTASIAGYSMNQNLIGEQYFYGIQLGGTYKIIDHLSVFGGVRAVIAKCSYVGAISGISGDVKLPQAMGGAVMPGYAKSEDFNLDCSQSALGITPILGVNFNYGKWNLAAKYEFRTKINLENDSKNSANVDALMPQYANGAKVRSDIPAILSMGAQYSVLPSLRLNLGYNQYFDKKAQGASTAVSKNTFELNFGTEWDITDRIMISAGVQRTQYGFEDKDMTDTNFNISSTAVCVGGAYKFCENVKLNIGYMHSFYGDHTVEANGMKDVYTRKNDVVGASLDFKF